jgi:hypothetical protein
MGTGATAFPSSDWDYWMASVNSAPIYYNLDPSIEVTNNTGLSLQVCMWWRATDGTPAVSCPSGTSAGSLSSSDGWLAGTNGCCKTSSSTAISFTIDPSDTTGWVIYGMRSTNQSCGTYTFRYRM